MKIKLLLIKTQGETRMNININKKLTRSTRSYEKKIQNEIGLKQIQCCSIVSCMLLCAGFFSFIISA